MWARDASDITKRDSPMVLEETDSQLIDACRRGESVAFRELFERYKDKVYSVALRYSGDAETAQDIAQDTFVKLFAAIGGFRGDSSFDSWLYRMVVNSCFDHKRRTRRFLPMIAGVFDLLRAPGATALDDVLREEMSDRVRAVVDGLPPEQRMVIVLRYTQGLSYEEIGEAMGCSAGTVASRLNRVHKVLSRRLTHLDGRKNRV
jgi:RNA polymerase sigma-70 factor (ECF subfamily)